MPRFPSLRRVVFFASLVGAMGATSWAARGGPVDPVDQALAYLGREVPAWSPANQCFSCHNNGDAARALYEAVRLGRVVAGASTGDTDAWLANPERWDRNGGDGPFSDKVLARVAFTSSLATAVAAKRVDPKREPLLRAARRLVLDQDGDGSWRVESADPVGSPATYGRPLATWLAMQTLQQADPLEFAPAIERAATWLRRVEPTNAPNASTVLLHASSDPKVDHPVGSVDEALRWFAKNQAKDGGWGPFGSSPPEVYDTALGVLGLAKFEGRPGVSEQIRRARDFLVANQQADGSWVETTRPSGGESYAQRLSTTGWATLALLSGPTPKAAQNLHPNEVVVDLLIARRPLPHQCSRIETTMADPRNIAHDKKVMEEKKHHNEPVAPENAAVAPQPGKKTPTVKETPHEEPTSSHATSQHHKDKTTGHIEEPAEVQAEVNAKENATDK